MDDHVSTFMRSHLFENTNSAETLAAKYVHKRVAKAYRVNSYHVDNIRYNNANYKALS